MTARAGQIPVDAEGGFILIKSQHLRGGLRIIKRTTCQL